MLWIAIGIGGALGAVMRHGVTLATARLLREPVPYATGLVNIVGCLAIGVLAGLAGSGRLPLSPNMRAFAFVGVLGGFTTFSSFGLDTLALIQGGRPAAAIGNVALQVGLGLLGVSAGYAAGRAL